jgi:hypothetical protein
MEPSWLNERSPDIHVSYPDSRFLVDGSVAHPGAPSYCRTAAFTRLHAAKTREARKSSLYKSLAAKEGKFAPFVLESYGGFGVHAKSFMDELVRQANDHGQPSVLRFRFIGYLIGYDTVYLFSGWVGLSYTIVRYHLSYVSDLHAPIHVFLSILMMEIIYLLNEVYSFEDSYVWQFKTLCMHASL